MKKKKAKKQTNQKTPPKNNSVTYFVLQAGVSVQCKDQNKALRIKHVNVCVFVEAADKRDNGRLYIWGPNAKQVDVSKPKAC